MANETIRLRVKVLERTSKDGGRKFNVYKTFSKNDRRMDLKFVKEIKELPTKDCYIVCNKTDVNVNDSGLYPVVWVKDIQVIDYLDTITTESNVKKVEDYFGA